MNLELEDLVVFATVAESGSFAAAARLLDVPTSTLSRRVADYERRGKRSTQAVLTPSDQAAAFFACPVGFGRAA